jgi:D-glycero-alpha-D-manno-heptose-7-phosphate kinase
LIIARSPLRISLGGGGTDVPSYYEKFGGFVISAAIDKYVYVTTMKPFNPGIYLKYSETELAGSISEIKHPIIREVLKVLKPRTAQVEITSLADIPSGTGLGSSGSFTTALIKSLYTFYQLTINTAELAELACHIEIDCLNEPVGKQDQYISAYGGITEFVFEKNSKVYSKPLHLPMPAIHNLEENLLLFYTGHSRSASSILRDQVERSSRSEGTIIENLHKTKEMGIKSRDLLMNNDVITFGELMHEHWMNKRNRSRTISSSFIDEAYNCGIKSGAVGGKLVGAGGGGFLMFYAKDVEKLRSAMSNLKLQEVRFRFDFEGTKIILA